MTLDAAALAFFQQAPWPSLAPAARAVSDLGSIYAWWALVLVLALLRRWELALPLAAALLLADAGALALKGLVARPRPPSTLGIVDPEFAFPSGHAMRAAAGATVASLLAARRWAAPALAFAGLVALARLVAQAHWLTDVLAGLALGAALGAGVALAWRRDAAGLRTRAQAVVARVDPRARAAAR